MEESDVLLAPPNITEGLIPPPSKSAGFIVADIGSLGICEIVYGSGAFEITDSVAAFNGFILKNS